MERKSVVIMISDLIALPMPYGQPGLCSFAA